MLPRHPIRIALATLAAFGSPTLWAQVVYTYDNATVTNIGENNSACSGSPALLDFVVPASDNYTVNDVAVGLDITHDTRGQLRVDLRAPGGAFQTILGTSGDTANNYRITLSSNAEGAANDGDADNYTAVPYRRLVPRGAFTYSGTANGTWTLRVCDTNTAGAVGTVNSARLTLRNTAGTVVNQCGSTVSFDWGSLPNNSTFSSNTTLGITVSQGATSGEAANDIHASFITQTGTMGGHAGHYFFRMDTTGDSEPTAEFTTFNFDVPVRGLSFSLLDADLLSGGAAYEDMVKVDAFDASGATVPKRMVLGGAQLAYAGEWAEADSSVDSAATQGNVTYTFAREVSSVRIYYAQSDEPAADVGNQWIGVSDLSYCGFDYGDAPASYNVSFGANGPRHTMGPRSLFLGATPPDGESDASGNAAANADGADEDGIASWPTYVSSGMTCGSYTSAAGEYCASVTLTNSSTSAAQLVGWIDFNGDGDFNDAGERSLPRLGGGSGGAGDNTFTTGNIAASSGSQTRVLVWSGFGIPVNASTATYGRIRLTTEPSFFSDTSPQPNGLARDGEVEDYLLPVGTLPVSLSKVRSSLGPDGWRVEFSTATEAGNIGFDILSHQGKLTRQPIPAAEQGVAGGDYEIVLPAGELKEFWIEDIAIDGSRKAHGPFQAGRSYGTESGDDRIDWTAIRDELPQPVQGKSAARALLLGAQATGIHQVRFETLAASGFALGAGVDARALSLTDAGKPVALHVAHGGDGVFGPGDHLEYVATRTANRYSDTNWLTLSVDGRGISPTVLPTTRTASPKIVPATYTQEADRQFNLSIEGDAPWVDDRLLAYDRPVSLARTFVLPAMAPLTPVRAEVSILGGTDLANPGPDHSVVAAINGQHRVAARFDGAVPHLLTIDMPNGLLPGTQELSLEVAADLGLPFDLVHYDRLSVQYLRYTFAVDGLFEARFEAADGFALGGLAKGGSLWATGPEGSWRLDVEPGVPASVGNPKPGTTLDWIAAGPERILAPQLRRPSQDGAAIADANFLVIAHPALAAASADYVALQKARGHRVALVTTDSIYARFSDHEPSARAITDFIRATHAASPLAYVTLVGADSYDYRNALGLGSISFVPTHYVRTSTYIAQTPSDALHADVDGDEVADLAIGRIPARTPEEMLRMTRKIRMLGERTLDAALFVAGADTSGAKRFGGLSLDFATGLPATVRTNLVQLDEYARNDVRQAILDGFNAGTPLISYTGHTAPALWDFSGLLFAQDAATLTNGGAPNLVTQWGCWNSYFVDPHALGLSHQLLAAEGGAGTIYGATTLTEDASHSLLGQLFFEAVGAGARTIGEAELIAKRRLAELRPEARDAQLGMQVLGDPALPVRF